MAALLPGCERGRPARRESRCLGCREGARPVRVHPRRPPPVGTASPPSVAARAVFLCARSRHDGDWAICRTEPTRVSIDAHLTPKLRSICQLDPGWMLCTFVERPTAGQIRCALIADTPWWPPHSRPGRQPTFWDGSGGTPSPSAWRHVRWHATPTTPILMGRPGGAPLPAGVVGRRGCRPRVVGTVVARSESARSAPTRNRRPGHRSG